MVVTDIFCFSFFRCDADPAALAKYVIALAKKDKPQPELQALCEDQLDVFLGDSKCFDIYGSSPEVKVEKLMSPCKKGGHDRFLQKC